MKRNRQKRDPAAGSETVTIASPDTDVENFGPWLKQQREVREIDAREVADASKISVRYIEALESNRFEVLPAEVFTKGFLRQYAVYVGLDPEEVVNYYLAALQAQRERQEPDLELSPRPRGSRNTNAKWLLAALVVGALLISVVWLLFRMSDRVSLGDGGVTTSPIPAGANKTGSAPSTSRVAPPAPPRAEVGQDEVPPTAAADPRASTSLATPSPQVEGGLVGSPAEPSSASLPAPTNLPVASDDPAADTSAPLTVVIDFSGDCWVEATIDQGRRLAEMRVQGESLRLEANSTLQVKLGNARVVEIEVNGMPYPVEPNPGSSVVDLQLDLQTVADLRASNSNAGNR